MAVVPLLAINAETQKMCQVLFPIKQSLSPLSPFWPCYFLEDTLTNPAW